MRSNNISPPLIVIVGQTATGKSSLAINLARRFDGEIIAADSRTIYKEMDIGTAKPTDSERKKVEHHLINVANPTTTFTVADFKALANGAISDIVRRGKLPFLVGGTGLYVDAILFDFGFRAPADQTLRQALEGLSVEELQARVVEQGFLLPNNSRNPRHLIRVLETDGQLGERSMLRQNTLIIGLAADPAALRENVARRVELMVANGLAEEVRALGAKYGWDLPALQAPAYKAFRPYIEGQIGLDEAKQRFVQYDLQYAKRQKTWFKRNDAIQWISKPEDAVDLVTTFLNK